MASGFGRGGWWGYEAKGFHIDELIERAGGAWPGGSPALSYIAGSRPGDVLEVAFHRVDPAGVFLYSTGARAQEITDLSIN